MAISIWQQDWKSYIKSSYNNHIIYNVWCRQDDIETLFELGVGAFVIGLSQISSFFSFSIYNK